MSRCLLHRFFSSRRRARQGQTRTESILALALFILAALGARALYGDQIAATARAMIEFFTGPK